MCVIVTVYLFHDFCRLVPTTGSSKTRDSKKHEDAAVADQTETKRKIGTIQRQIGKIQRRFGRLLSNSEES